MNNLELKKTIEVTIKKYIGFPSTTSILESLGSELNLIFTKFKKFNLSVQFITLNNYLTGDYEIIMTKEGVV